VRVILLDAGKISFVYGRGTELNQGGMGIFAGVELEVGVEIDIEFTPPYSGKPVRVRGEVRNRNGYFYGVEFLTHNLEQLENVEHVRHILQAMGSRIP
jgi:hypothetical protein